MSSAPHGARGPKLSRHWSLQLGAFYSPAGQNALVERGLAISLWTQD
jgi:hypothetical protein